jgi:hypothetical protein
MRTPIGIDGSVLSSSGIGYAPGVGAGGTVTQITSKATGVTLAKVSGTITTHAASLADAATVVFTVTNTKVAAGDRVIVDLVSGAASAGTYQVWTEAAVAGSFKVCIRNHSGGALAEALVLGFLVVKGATT